MGFFDRYPYTNWHNVNLDWVLERVKEWGEMVVANDLAFKDLEEANASFKEYVTNYLQNLDVQEEINNKLDLLLQEGFLTGYAQPYITETVNEWLSENITQPTTPVIDESLTVQGAGADSYITGQRINELSEYITTALSEIFSEQAKNALLECIRHIGAWDNASGEYYYNRLYNALFGSLIDWDFSWNFVNGLPQDNGLDVVNTGSGNILSLTSSGLLVSIPNTSGNSIRIRYRLDSLSHIYNNTICEWKFSIIAYGTKAMTSNLGYGIRCMGGLGYNSSNTPAAFPGLQICFNGNHIMFRNATPSWQSLEDEEPLEVETDYTVRIICNLNGGLLYVNGELICDIPMSQMSELVGIPAIVVTEGSSINFKSFNIKLND